MRKLTFIIFVFGVILSLQCCASFDKKLPEPEGVLLGQRELEEGFSNERTYTVNTNKLMIEVTNTAFPNGTMQATWGSGEDSGKDTGTYRIINGQFCQSWKSIDNGKEKCWKVYKINENKHYVECTDGSEYGYSIIK